MSTTFLHLECRGNRKCRSAFSLLEVILALAVLAASLAMLGQLVGLGFRSARESQGLTEAQMIAETVMDEIALGLLPPDPVEDMNVSMLSDLTSMIPPQDSPWVYSIDWEPAPIDGLLMVVVSVRRADAQSAEQNDVFRIVRWMRDPTLAVELTPQSSQFAPTGQGGSF